MAKGEEDAIIMKKPRSDSSTVSNRIAAVIAQKKRRQSGKRRMRQGMCFSLPTQEDPFNDKNMNLESKKTKKVLPSKEDNNLTGNGNTASQNKRKAAKDHKSNGQNQGQKKSRVEKESTLDDEGCPSKFLISCLKTVQDTMRDDEAFERGKPFFFDSWGFEYWRCYTRGTHVLETSGCATTTQIAWIGSTVVDTITSKELDGESFTGPYLLFIVPSQERATQVRTVYKSLKAFGIHTVSLHSGASIDHQIHGLKACEPEFIVCTPDRLLELVSMDVVDISGVCSLIVDGLECSSGDAYFNSVKSIKKYVSVDPHTVVFCSGLTNASSPALTSLLPAPTCSLSRDEIYVNKSAT